MNTWPSWTLFALASVLGLVLSSVLTALRRRLGAADRARLLREGVRGSGVVTEAWEDCQGWNISYEFVPRNGSAIVRRTMTFEGGSVPTLPVGTNIQVVYEPFAPHYSTIVDTGCADY